jgi:hypothetical protein
MRFLRRKLASGGAPISLITCSAGSHRLILPSRYSRWTGNPHASTAHVLIVAHASISPPTLPMHAAPQPTGAPRRRSGPGAAYDATASASGMGANHSRSRCSSRPARR